MRADLEGEARTQRDKMANDLRVVEGLIKQLAADLAAGSAEAPPVAREKEAAVAAPALAAIEKIEPEAEEEEVEVAPEGETVTVLAIEEETLVVSEDEASIGFLGESARKEDAPAEPPVENDLPEATDIANIGESEMLEIVSQAIEAGRVDLYLQKTVTLPERRARYFEAFTRIRTKADSLIRPRSYLPVAENSGMMPLIDNVLLVKSVQTLKRLGAESRIKGVFCNISVSTLLDPEFFPELVEFMEENSGLSESLIFEVGQSAIAGLGTTEFGALDTLAALGYGFSLDHVADFELDFVGLRDRSFRFVKTDARTFLRDKQEGGGGFSAADMKRALDDFNIKLIVEKVEDEDTVARLLDRGVELAQGHLFGKPRPMSPALFREVEGAGAG